MRDVCRDCRRGQFQMCERELINGFTRFGGCEYRPGLQVADAIDLRPSSQTPNI